MFTTVIQYAREPGAIVAALCGIRIPGVSGFLAHSERVGNGPESAVISIGAESDLKVIRYDSHPEKQLLPITIEYTIPWDTWEETCESVKRSLGNPQDVNNDGRLSVAVFTGPENMRLTLYSRKPR